jgi:hypothetical protein
MRTLLRIGVYYFAMTFMMPAALLAGDLLDGIWELDTAASKFNPGPARKSDIRVYKVDGNIIHMTGKVVGRCYAHRARRRNLIHVTEVASESVRANASVTEAGSDDGRASPASPDSV